MRTAQGYESVHRRRGSLHSVESSHDESAEGVSYERDLFASCYVSDEERKFIRCFLDREPTGPVSEDVCCGVRQQFL